MTSKPSNGLEKDRFFTALMEIDYDGRKFKPTNSSPPLALQVPILLECMENLSILHKFLLFYNFLQKIVIFPPFPKIAFLLSKENSVPILQNTMALF